MSARLSYVALFLYGTCVFAQGVQNSAASNSCDEQVLLKIDVVPGDLIDLIMKSQLIVDGTVAISEPTINTNRNESAPTLETRSVVAVNATLKGAVPGNSVQILLAQTGGRYNNRTQCVSEDPLVLPGERYILFLKRDARKDLPETSDTPRYAVIGIWTGKVKIVNGAVTVADKAIPALHMYNGMDVDMFLETVRGFIRQPYTEQDKKLPINLAPQSRP